MSQPKNKMSLAKIVAPRKTCEVTRKSRTADRPINELAKALDRWSASIQAAGVAKFRTRKSDTSQRSNPVGEKHLFWEIDNAKRI
jgi:hypothetical protein